MPREAIAQSGGAPGVGPSLWVDLDTPQPMLTPSIPVFSSTANRDSTWPLPYVGAMCITSDTGSLWQYFATQGWYKPFSVLNRTMFTANVSGITGAGSTILTTASVTIPAGRRLAIVGHIYCEFLNNGGWIWGQMDGANVGSATLAQFNTLTSGATLHGEQSFTPAAGNHTFSIVAVPSTGSMNARGDLSNGYVEIRDWGAA